MADARKTLEYVLLKIEKGCPKIVDKKRKLSISSVAEEADVTSQLIHVSYPDIAEKIRLKTGQEAQKKNETKNKKLREKIRILRSQISMLTSINESLHIDNEELKDIINSTNTKKYINSFPFQFFLSI